MNIEGEIGHWGYEEMEEKVDEFIGAVDMLQEYIQMFEVAGEANHMQVLMFEVFMDNINEHSELGNLRTIKFLNLCESRDIIINRMP